MKIGLNAKVELRKFLTRDYENKVNNKRNMEGKYYRFDHEKGICQDKEEQNRNYR